MFDKFGKMESAAEINELAGNLLKEGDRDSISILAKENGIDPDIAEAFAEGQISYICEDDKDAAYGRISVEAEALKPAEIMLDWIEYIKATASEDADTARTVLRKDKSLEGMIAHLLKWSFAHQYDISKEIMKAAGVSASRCTLGIPGSGTVKKLIREYYTGGAQ